MKRTLSIAGLSAAAFAASGNMNGKYSVASGLHQDTGFNDDYASKGHEYFDVWAPEISTHYGEVFWTDQLHHPLPKEIVARFKGKTMAITGYEQDQVMVFPTGQAGVNPTKDVSVPINWAYNHHYMMYMTGQYSKLEKVDRDPDDVLAHGAPRKWMAVDNDAALLRADPSMPGKQMFSEGNGGESRKSFHGYPDGFAQLIESPEEWHITPMQIDTRNRDCGITVNDLGNCTKYTPGPEPKQARYGMPIPKNTPVSGILECPCTERFGGDPTIYPDTKTRELEHVYKAIGASACDDDEPNNPNNPTNGKTITTALQCWDSVAAIGLSKITKHTTNNPKLPRGCSVVEGKDGSASATFNSATQSSSQCSSSPVRAGQTTSAINTTLKVTLNATADLATIEVSGPSKNWFGIGLNAVEMDNSPWTLVSTPDGIFEQQIGTCGSEAEHCIGTLLNKSITVLSNTVVNGIRTVTVTRPLKGLTKAHYSFDLARPTIPFITASGYSSTFGYHHYHAPCVSGTSCPVPLPQPVITLLAANEPTCVCNEGIVGKLCGSDGKGCKSFTKKCKAAPAGSLLEQKNPTCNSGSYVGGLRCCSHKTILLDVDQPIRPELLKYHMKFRFWFQEYKPQAPNSIASKPSHYNLDRIYQQTEANAGEYDIPPAFAKPGFPIPGYDKWPANKTTPGTTCTGTCPDGDDCECVHTIHYKWIENPTKPMRLIYAGGHCHAPSCISMELYRNDTGELLCLQSPKIGKGTVTDGNKFDEEGYIAVPPCLWGADKGLQPSILLPAGTPLLAIKKNRNTHMGHYGEMASWQMRGTFF